MSKEKAEKERKLKKITIVTEKLKQQIKELESQNKEYFDKLLRNKADFENFKKRMLKEQSLAIKYASEKVIHRLLPIIDDLDRALESISSGQEPDKIIEGVKITHKDIQNLLKEHAVHEINPVGEPFNPAECEAVCVVESDEHEDDCIVEVLQKGYKLDGKLVRPAKVSICRSKGSEIKKESKPKDSKETT